MARIRHLEREQTATLLLDHYSPRWETLWWIRLEAQTTVCVVPDAPTPSGVNAGLHGIEKRASEHPGALALREKYQQYQSTALFTGEPTLLSFRVTRQSAWAAEGLPALQARWSEKGQ